MRPVRIVLDPSVSVAAPEVKYVFRTLLRVAGLPWEFRWASTAEEHADVYYGPPRQNVRARLRIHACDKSFSNIAREEPDSFRECFGLPFLEFTPSAEPMRESADGITFSNDIIYSSFWMLVGGPEPHYPRDRWDNLDLSGSFFNRHCLQAKPLVSMYAAFLRRRFQEWGWPVLPFPPAGSFVFTHDVDYPQMIRGIECLRLFGARGFKGLSSIAGVLRGTNHFWTFAEWVDWQKQLGTRPTFYFMARQGSLLQYALGTPDDFYDIRTRKFLDLFRYLREEGCEIGLHASYNAWRSVDTFRREKLLIEETTGAPVHGNRHHYWHLDPRAPYETLELHAQAGLSYDSSLGLEYYPGFRRGICHPFRPYHPDLRREIGVVQLPPAWMDDHFDRRLARNGIADPVAYANSLLRQVDETGGIAVVDYHSRGMNPDFYPRYGPWLKQFIEKRMASAVTFRAMGEVASAYLEHERTLQAHSRDMANLDQSAAAVSFEIARMRPEDARAVALLHHELFGDPKIHGHSIATFGPDFLERVFYRLNLDNPYFFCDVARYGGRVIGFSVYCTRHTRVFRHVLRRKYLRIAFSCLRLLALKPRAVPGLFSNARYARGEKLPGIDGVSGWWIVAGVDPECRTRDFEERTGVRVASRLFDRMEGVMAGEGCGAWYGVVRPDNPAIKKFLERRGAQQLGTARAQGILMDYYIRTLETHAVAGNPVR